MEDEKKPTNKSRRWFLSGGLSDSGKKTAPVKKEMVKMLTAEGKLVEIDKAIFDQIAKRQKATNKEIYDWMKNPSKENNG